MRRHKPRDCSVIDWIGEFTRHYLDGCICFTRLHGKDGYGSLWNGEKIQLVHRLWWEYFVGPIPPDKELSHTCCRLNCYNLDHLVLRTRQEIIDAIELRGRDHPRGDKHGRAIKAEVKLIMQGLRLAGWSIADIANEFSYSVNTVERACLGFRKKRG